MENNKKLKILCIGDTANNAYMMSKITNKSNLDIINFPRVGSAKNTYSENVRFFKSYLISKQVDEVNKIKSNYDLCFVSSWEGARVAYLSNLNYVFFFVGGDVYEQPFIKNAKTKYLKNPIHSKNFFERWLLKKVLENAIVCVTSGGIDFVKKLKKFHPAVLRMDMFPVGEEFLKKHEPVNKSKKKFTFFSPQRQGLEKGMDVIWEAINFTSTDFEILQVNWFDRRTPEENEIAERYIKNIPKKIKLIPMIKWDEMPKFYAWSDAVMGQMRFRHGSIEREAVLCGKPVLHYSDPNEKFLINGTEYEASFLPKSKDPKELAKIIDRIVSDDEFRNNLLRKELEFIKKLTDRESIGIFWDELFIELFKKYRKIDKNSSNFKIKILYLICSIFEILIYKRKWSYKLEK